MTIIESTGLKSCRLIPIEEFATCLLDGKTRKEISALYPGNGVYYLSRFDRYLQEHHGMTIKDYCVQHGGIEWPKCPESGKDVGYCAQCGKGLILRRYAHHAGATARTSSAIRANAERMSIERRGEGNPMHGKTAWNAGITAEMDERVARSIAAAHAAPFTPERREKMRKARAEHPLKARHAMPHSAETCEKMRIITARRWTEGLFNKGATSIHVKMREFLRSLTLNEQFAEEHQEVYYSIDFAFPQAKVAIECDGDYFHCNPQFFPNGPKDAIQRRNAGRDKAKNSFLGNRGWTVIRYWECEINAGSFKKDLLCKLKQFGLLSR